MPKPDKIAISAPLVEKKSLQSCKTGKYVTIFNTLFT
jgi:hypothetical protein